MRLSDGTVLFSWPLAQHTLTAGYYYNDGSYHGAIDMRAASGTPVYAAEDGTVDWTQVWDGSTKTGNQSYGTALRIRHADAQGKTLQTRYAHLSSLAVAAGANVRGGQLIGYSGVTGNITGPHLHFEVIWDGVRRNPLVWLDGDFNTASSAVYTYGPGEGPVQRPNFPAGAMQKLVIGPVSAGDAEIFRKFAYWLGVPDRFRIETYDNGTRVVVLGLVSAGDAQMAYLLADFLGLVEQGLFRSEAES